jgi:N-acetylneuraminic acid mutarotase
MKIFFICLFFTVMAFPQANWERVGNMPNPVSGASIVKKDSLIYIFGGYSDSLQSEVDFIQEFNPARNTWRIAGHMNEKRIGLCAANYGDSVLIFGGIKKKSSRQTSIEVWNYNASPLISASNSVFGRNFSSAVVYNRKLIIIGGVQESGSPSDSTKPKFITEFNVQTSTINGTVDTIFTMQQPSQQMCAVIDTNIYIMGGVYNGVLKNVFSYSPLSKKVTQLNHNLMQARAGGAVVPINKNLLFIVGGSDESDGPVGSSELYYTGINGISAKGPTNIEPRKECMAIAFGQYIYVFGGENNDFNVERSIERIRISDLTDVKSESPQKFAKTVELLGNYPNPFNPSTMIKYRVPYAQNISVLVYDATGREVAKIDEGMKESGDYSVRFGASESLTSGVYFYRIKGDNAIKTGKMILMR